jgi:hypothetical protein
MRTNTVISTLVVVISLLLVTESSTAQQAGRSTEVAAASRTNEWMQFRGPNGTGVAEGFALPSEFDATKNLAWKVPVPFARSSPIVTADSRVHDGE